MKNQVVLESEVFNLLDPETVLNVVSMKINKLNKFRATPEDIELFNSNLPVYGEEQIVDILNNMSNDMTQLNDMTDVVFYLYEELLK